MNPAPLNANFSGKVAFVTGGASGLGKFCATDLCQRGARVVIVDLPESPGTDVENELKQSGTALFLPGDVSKKKDVSEAVKRTVKEFGTIDLALNNAGIDGIRAKTAEYPEEVWHAVVATNLTGLFFCLQEELAVMAPKKSGVIINMSSVAGVTGFPGHAAYTASKHGVVGLTRTAAIEYARDQIRVNAICPAYTRTPMVERMIRSHPSLEIKLKERIPLGRLGTPEEISAAVLYLFSDASAFITGQTLVMDGGIMAE